MTPIHCTRCGGFTAKPRDGACDFCGFVPEVDRRPVLTGLPGEIIEYDPRYERPRQTPGGAWVVDWRDSLAKARWMATIGVFGDPPPSDEVLRRIVGEP